jgi:hypothetical protein
MPSAKELAKALAYQGQIRNTPQNKFLGRVANFLAPVSEFADRDKLPESIPLLGGMSFADLSGLKGAESLVRDMSYGKSPVRGATLNTVKVDPRLLDVAAVSGAMIPIGKALSKAALREGARQIETGTGVLGRNVIDPRMSVVPKGKAMPDSPAGLLGHPKLNVLPNERFALVEGNSYLRVEHKPDGTFTISHSPAWGKTGKPFTLNGDSVDDLISTAESRLKRSEVAMTAAAKSKHSKTVGGMLELKHGDNFEYTKSARSDSQYITHTPTGAKIRISDHKLPDVYESPDFEVSGALSKKEQAQSISKFLDDYATERAKDDASIGVVPDDQAMSVPAKTQYELAHEVAQRNAALPVEQGGLGLPEGNTAMDRAGAMGFDTPAYHGTNVEFDSFDPSKTKLVNGVFSSTDPSGASAYVEAKNAGLPTKHEGGFVMPLRINNEKSVTPEYFNLNNIRSGLAEGNNVVGGDVIVIPDAKNIRSRFAAFDPMRRHEADILAGVGVGGMLDPQAIAEALRQQDRK